MTSDYELHLIESLKRLLGIEGVPVEPVNVGAETSVLEPFCNLSPEVWVTSAAFHLVDIRRSSKSLVSDLTRMVSTARDGVALPEGVCSDIGAGVLEIRFHAADFPLYAYLVRDKMEQREYSAGLEGLWTPTIYHRRTRSRIPDGLLANHLTSQLGMPKAIADRVEADLADLDRACRMTCRAIDRLSLDAEKPLDKLSQRFTEVQFSVYSLLPISLRADVSTEMLRRYSPVEDY